MEHIIGYLLTIIVGISLGLVGSGGSILMVPILVYILSINPTEATTYSMFIVGITALIGGLKNVKDQKVDFNSSIYFGVASICSIFITRKFIFPQIPDPLFIINTFVMSKNIFVMTVFAFFMILASYNMIQSKTYVSKDQNISKIKLILSGLIVGFISGIVGIGGGFLIIPALIYLANLDMKVAIGTSLIIVAINALIGFLGSNFSSINPNILALCTLLSVLGVFIGNYLAKFIDGSKLKKGFGWFILVMGIYILIKELLFK